MIYDEETDRYYLNEFHLQNTKHCREFLKNQKPLSPEEAEAQTLAIHQEIEKEQNSIQTLSGTLEESQERTKKAVESQKPQGYTAEEMKEQWRRNHEASLRKGTDRHYLNEFHKKNSEEAMRILSKQKPLSREEKEAQTERIHKAID